MKCAIEVGSGGMIYVQRFMKIGWYYRWEGFMNYAGEMCSGAMIHTPSFIKMGSDIRKLTGGNTYTVTKVIS
jgi:hypothetical protein